MRPCLVPLMLASAVSCASSGSSSGSEMPSPTDRIVASDNHTTYRTTVAPNAKVPIAVPPGRAFTALKAVYEELGIPAAINEPVVSDQRLLLDARARIPDLERSIG